MAGGMRSPCIAKQRNRGPNKTPAEKVKMLLAYCRTYGDLETYGKDKRKRGVAEMSAAWGVPMNFWGRLVAE
eukprot:4261318-Prymnesium_polylepis.1